MIITYFDEAGDDGFPVYSSPLFVLSCIYMEEQNWQENFQQIYNFRRSLKTLYGFPIKLELHTRDFLLNKKPFDQAVRLSDETRIKILDDYCTIIRSLKLRIINVVINKTVVHSDEYDVLDRAFTYSIQRIENDLNSIQYNGKFMIITDPGRVGKMVKIARRLQKINYVPSKYGPGAYRSEIRRLIEDPLEKNSDQSYFIQVADFITYVIYQYKSDQLKIADYPKRFPKQVNSTKILHWMNELKPCFNTKLSVDDPFGIVCYPKI